jgi:hypothetical protein
MPLALAVSSVSAAPRAAIPMPAKTTARATYPAWPSLTTASCVPRLAQSF